MASDRDDEIDWSVFQRPATGGPTRRTDRFDGYVNPLTLLGDHTSDKTFGGLPGNLPFRPAFLSSVEIEARWSGSDLGGRVIEAIPNEMTREWLNLQVQPTEDDDKANDDGAEIVEKLAAASERLEIEAAFNQALKYEQAYGGAAILIGTEEDVSKGMPLRLDEAPGGFWDDPSCKGTDGTPAAAMRARERGRLDATDPRNLTEPLDWSRVRKVSHLTVFTGGWDGEAIGWRYRNDMLGRAFGAPEIYMVRNLGVPLSGQQAPGEAALPPSVAGPTISYVHTSRLLVFPGVAASRRVRMWNRGWGVSGFTRVEERLSAFNQTWQSIALLMQELEVKSLGMSGLADLLSKNDTASKSVVKTRALELARSFSVARMYVHDKDEEFKRQPATLAGVSDVLREMVIILAAAAEMPLSVLLGQIVGGLGTGGDGDQAGWENTIHAKQKSRMLPQARTLFRGLFLAGDSPTGGTEPERWSLKLRPLRQATPTEEAARRKTIAETDQIYVTMGGPTAEEVTMTRFAGSEFNDGPITLDLAARDGMKGVDVPALPVPATPPPNPAPARPTTDEFHESDITRVPGGEAGGGRFGHGGGGPTAPSTEGGTKWQKVPTTPIPQTQARDKETGEPIVKKGRPVMTGAPPGTQLEPHIMARLQELGARLPPAHIGDVHVSEHLFHPEKANEGAVVKWTTQSKTGKPSGVVGVSTKQQEESHDRIFARTEEMRPKMAALQKTLEAKAATSQPHAAAALIAATGLRRGSDDNEPGHYGALTMEARHVTISGGHADIRYVGKEGVVNTARVTQPAIVNALKDAVAGKGPHDPVWGKGVNERAVQATLLPGQKIKDLRTIKATSIAERMLGKITPKFTGDEKKDARTVAAVVRAVSGVVANRLNNKPAQALKSYIAPTVLRAWGEKHGVKKEWLP